jgi:hypothetical protein
MCWRWSGADHRIQLDLAARLAAWNQCYAEDQRS